jgi:hypothetical protein
MPRSLVGGIYSGSLSLLLRRGMFLFLVALVFGVAPQAHAAHLSLYATTTSNRLVQFSAANPCLITSEQHITGLQDGESILGIDFRPATRQLYGLGSSRLYVIDPATAIATAVGAAPFTPALEGSSFGFDFNPTVDRIRIVSNTGQSLRAHPDTGAVVAVDGRLAYAATDINAGSQPGVSGAAYTNPDTDPATGTTLYDIDATLDILATQNPPNAGALNTVGSLGLDTNDLVGFDINAAGAAYAALKVGKDGQKGANCGNSLLVSLDLTSGTATSLGYIGTSQPIRGLAAPISAPMP